MADDAVFHCRVLEWHQLHQGPGGNHHATRMLRHVARQSANLVRECTQIPPQGSILAAGKARQMFHLFGKVVRAPIRQLCDQLDFAEWQVECFADFAHGRAQPIGGERTHEPNVLGAVARVDTADQLLANLAGEIEIDVRHRREGLVQKAAEEELVRDRIDVRQAEEIADNGRDGGAAASARQEIAAGASRSAPDVGRDLAREIEEIVIDEKEAAELMMLDQHQFCLEPAHCLRVIERVFRVALLQTGMAQLGEGLGCGRAIGPPEVGECVTQIARQIEGATTLGDG